MGTKECFDKAGITLKDQIDMFGLDVDKNLPDGEIMKQLDLLGYSADNLTTDSIRNAMKQQEIELFRRQNQAKSQIAIDKFIRSYKAKPEQALAALITNDLNEIAGNVGAEKKMMSIVNLTHAKIAEFMSEMAPTKLQSFRGIFTGKSVDANQEKLLRDVVSEIFGTKTNNPDASRFAKSLGDALDDMNNRYANLTGDQSRMKDWGLPQRHDSVKIGKAKFDDWFSFTRDRLDIPRMIAKNPELADEENLRYVLAKVYDTLRTDGTSKIDARPVLLNGDDIKPNYINPRTMKNINVKHQNQRFLTFKDGDSWLEYQNKFGTASVYQTITDHIMSQAREISLMETFGPDHEAGFAYAKSVVQKKTESKTSTKMAEAYYDTLKGYDAGAPTKAAQILKSFRDWNVATKLGGAVISAQTDHAFAAQTALYNGLSSTRLMKQYVKQLSKAGQEEAAKVALTGEFALDRLTAAFEYNNAMNVGKAKAMADFTMRATGMEAHTVAMRQAFGVEFLQAMAGQADIAMKDLPQKLAAAYKRYGIDSDMWDQIRKTELSDIRGAKVLDPTKIKNSDAQSALMGMILTETDFAVPSPNVRERTIAALGSKAGTVHGEVIRNLTQFTSFPITANIKHIAGRGLMNGSINPASKMAYTARLAVTTTLLGALVYQAKQIAMGKEPRDWNDADFWMSAADQGGYFGLVGSFLLNTEGYYSGYSGGPMMSGPIQDLAYTLVAGNIQKIKDGKDTTISEDATNFIVKNIPGNNIWYARLALERTIFDQLRKATNPNYEREMNSRMRKMQREKGQEYWWKPAELTPNGGM